MDLRKFSNAKIAGILREVAAAYEVKGEDQFRIQAYNNAAATVEHATEEIRELWEEGKLGELAGIGASIEGHLNELFKKGQVKHFEEVKKGLPGGMFALLDVPGIGAKSAYRLALELKLSKGNALVDLYRLAKKGKIRKLSGFGETSERAILENLDKVRKTERRMSLPEATDLAKRLVDYLKSSPKVIRAEALGSLRRCCSSVGDIDIAVSTNDTEAVVSHFVRYPGVSEVLNEGAVKGRIILENGRQIDLMTQKPEAFGALLQHFTGSKNHNIHLRELAKSMGLSLSEYGIKLKSGKTKKFSTEEEFYRRLKMGYIPPELREDQGEIEAARSGRLPELIGLSDIRGDLQMHTDWSDGENTIKEMVRAAIKLDYEYIGITDHQMGLETHGYNNIVSEIKRRKLIIDHINSSEKNIRVLNGIEILIKSVGGLAYPDEILSQFDYVIAAVHTGFNQDRERITGRVIQALKNPLVKILAHPTGRLIGKRDSLDIDWKSVFTTCVKYHKILEINAFPDRLDLPDILVKAGKEAGVSFVIDSDAHSVEHLDLLEFGVSVARRGWLSKKDVINTLPYDKLIKVLGK